MSTRLRRSAGAAFLLFAAVSLSACGGLSAPDPAPTDAPSADPSYVHVIKPSVEGTELLCIHNGIYGSVSCNWELWNKQHEAKK